MKLLTDASHKQHAEAHTEPRVRCLTKYASETYNPYFQFWLHEEMQQNYENNTQTLMKFSSHRDKLSM